MDKLNILLVEDDPDDVELLHAAFQDSGIPFAFTILSQGDRVLNHLTNSPELPDVIVLDLNLPKMHGRDVLNGIKSRSKLKNIPVVILTTSSGKADMDFCLSSGAEHYLVKPSTMGAYRKVIDVIVVTASTDPPISL